MSSPRVERELSSAGRNNAAGGRRLPERHRGSSSGFGEGAAEQEGVEPAGQPNANQVPALPAGEASAVRGGVEAAPGWAGGAACSNEMLNKVTADTGPLIWEKVINTSLSPILLLSLCLT